MDETPKRTTEILKLWGKKREEMFMFLDTVMKF